MPDYRTPGVYVEEVPTLPPTVAAVETAVPVFIGYAPAVPEGDMTAVTIGSMADFDYQFGTAQADPTPMLRDALTLYYDNGGGDCLVVAVGDAAAFAADLGKDGLSPGRMQAGLATAGTASRPTLIVAPDAVAMRADDQLAFNRAMAAQAASLGDRFAILDVPGAGRDESLKETLAAFRTGMAPAGSALGYAAAYLPWLDATVAGATRAMPPSALVAGVYASTDRDRGVWKAPANVALNSVSEPLIQIDDSEQPLLSPDPGGIDLNAIRRFTGRGVLVWGARTLTGNDNAYRYVSVRRTAIFIEQSVRGALTQFAFEPNDDQTWIKIRGMVGNFLTQLWRSGAFQGSKPEQAFYVHCGLGQTMTQADIDAGHLIVELGIAMVRPAEFIIIRITQPCGNGS